MIRRIMRSVACLVPLVVLTCLTDAQAAGRFNVTANPPCPAAVPDDGLDDTAAFTCTISLLPAQGGEIYAPAGTYNLESTLFVTDRNVAFRGDGQGITRLVWQATTAPDHHGISFVSTPSVPGGVNYTLAVRSMSLLRSAGQNGAAIAARWPNPEWHGAFGVVTTTIHDVHIAADSWPQSNAYWFFGIQLTNSTTAKISTFNIHGPSSIGGIAGIQIEGCDPVVACTPAGPSSGHSVGVQIRDGSIARYVRGIEAKERPAGLHVQTVSIRDVSWGVISKDGPDGSVIANNVIFARRVGIQLIRNLDGDGKLAINNNLIHQIADEEHDFMGIWLDGINLSRVIGNAVHAPTPGVRERNGIVLTTAGVSNIIEGNTTHNMTRGIWLQSGGGVTLNTVVGNINRNAGTAIPPPGPGNYVSNNW